MRGPWQFEEPACAEVGGDLWFPEKNEDTREMRMAKQLCLSCTHKTECLEWAISNEMFGIWGGKSAVERKNIRRMRVKRAVSN